jgi:RNA polymerase sigma factor (sigma-70 family)
LVRQGTTDAFDVLYNRHLAIAQYVARQQTDNPSDADDVVAEAFASIFKSLKEGKGPKEFFRSYLLTVVRRTAHDRNKKARRTPTAPDEAILDSAVHDADTVVGEFESSTMAKAFKSLPERWQAVLWHLDIEGLKPAAVAPFVGLSPNGVSSLAIRAREGLRQAYLQQHISNVVDEACNEYASQLGKFARNALRRSAQEKVATHLADCAKCTAMLIELNDVQGAMRAVLFPLFTGLAFTPGAAAAFTSGLAAAPSPLASAGAKGSGVPWKIAAAMALGVVLLAGTVTLILQPVSQPTVAEAPPGTQAASPAETTTAAAAPPAVAEQLNAPSPEDPSPAPVPPQVITPEPPAVVVPEPPRVLHKASVINSAVVTGRAVPADDARPAKQPVEATFRSKPGPGANERLLELTFTLASGSGPTDGQILFTLPDEATFISGKVSAPAGWDCGASGARTLGCTAESVDPSRLGFVLGVSMPKTATMGTLDYTFSGGSIITKSFANTFR